jgi:hypothetical protein
MKRPFAATVRREGVWYVSQCLELDVARNGSSAQHSKLPATKHQSRPTGSATKGGGVAVQGRQ